MIQIRSFDESDTPQLADLLRQQAQLQESFDPVRQLAPGVDWSAHVSARCRRSNGVILIAEIETNVVGYLEIGVIDERRNPTSKFRLALRKLMRRPTAPRRSVFQPRRYGFIYDIYVEESVRSGGSSNRSAGVGTSLLKAGLDWLRGKQVDSVEARVASTNAGFRRFAGKHGFETPTVLVRKRL